MCCLRYEYDTYVQEAKLTPPVDATVKTPEGTGVITETNPLKGTVKVNINESIRTFHRDNVTVIELPKSKKSKEQTSEE
jgi:cell fate regulator YaaT (PSP1 superfamily)